MPVLTQPVRRTKSASGHPNGSSAGKASGELYLDYKGQAEAISRSQAVVELGMDGTILNANDNFLRAMGYTLDEIKGKDHSMFVEESYRQSPAYKAFWAELHRGEYQAGDYKRIGKGGREVWVQASYNPILDQHGKPFKVVAFASDLTEQRKLADELADFRVRLEMTNLTSIVSEADQKGDILTVNEKYIEVSKFSREELLGQPHSITRHPDMPKAVFKEMWATIGRGKMFRGIIKNRAKDGSPYYVDAVIAPVLGENGKPKKYIGVRYEITKTEIERHEMKGLVDAINESSCFAEYDTNGTLLNANANFLDLFGYKLEEVVGKPQGIFAESTYARSDAYTQFWNDAKAGKAHKDVFKRIAKGGREVWIQSIYAAVKDEMNRVNKVIEVGNDVTAQRAAAEDLNRKVDSILAVVAAATNGDLTQAITVSGEDAIGQMGTGLSRFLGNLRQSIGKIGQAADTLASSSGELTAVSQQMAANAEETQVQAGVVSKASDEVNKNLQTVATGTEEMGATIKEIAKNATEAARVASEAVKTAESTNATVEKLGESSAEIGQVIKVITSIAQQTNLLALNATIEAARAGEMGKGFAVVANEVKELAKQTAKATEDISQKIAAIQTDTKGAVDAIGTIGAIINQISDISSTIATAVEEQSATTDEMARNVGAAAQGSGEIARNIGGVSEAAESTARGANDSQMASESLSKMSAELRELVGKFQY